MRREIRLALAVGAAVCGLSTAGAANAAVSEIYYLTLDGCSGGCSPNSSDNVTVMMEGALLDITVNLFGGDQTHDTNDPSITRSFSISRAPRRSR